MGAILVIGVSLIVLAIYVLLAVWAVACLKAAITGHGVFIRNLTTGERWIEAVFSLVPIGIILMGIGMCGYIEIR